MKLRNLPIQRKLTTIVLLIASVSLLTTCLAFLTYDLVSFRKSIIEQTRTVADLVAANSAAALLFNDEKAAEEILSALKADETIVTAGLYNATNRLFAIYRSHGSANLLPRKPSREGYDFNNGYFEMFSPVIKDRVRVGTLYIKSDLHPLFDRVKVYVSTVGLVLCGALVLAFLLSHWLQRSIANPILNLADIAKAVSDRKDYTVRARKYGEDELGRLTEAFNHMLQQIDDRDTALRASQERLRLALEASNTGTWDWDLRTNTIAWDEFSHRLFGLKPGELGGKYEDFLRIVHPAHQTAVFEAIEHTIKSGRELAVEFQVIWPDSTVRYLAARGSAILDFNGIPIRMTGVCLDVTERKHAEEEIRSLNAELEQRVTLRTAELTASTREMEAFTYSVSHDLRAPLRHIIAFAEILKEESGNKLQPQSQEYVDRIINSARNLSRLVDDLLNLARIGRQGISRKQTNLNKIIDEVIADLGPDVNNRRIEWKIESIPVTACDPVLVKQVWANLISNAVKYTRPRTVAVIEIGLTDHMGEMALFIRDNGVGFDMKFVDKLFGVFQRLHRAEDFEGTGVGLATVERILQKHGGKVWAESKPNSGTVFYFTLGNTNSSSSVPAANSETTRFFEKQAK